MSQYVTQPIYSLSNIALVGSLFSKDRDRYKAISQELDNEADVNAFKWDFLKRNSNSIFIGIGVAIVLFLIFKFAK